MTYHQHDIATLRARIEFAVTGGAQVILTSPNGSESRAQVADADIIGIEAGPLKPGDKVTKGKGKTLAVGKVLHRIGETCWVEWASGDATLEPVANLTR